MSWKILKPFALGSVMVLLFIGGLRYADMIKPLMSSVSSQPSNPKAITPPPAQNINAPEKKSQAQQPLSVLPIASSTEATPQLGGEGTVSSQMTSPDKSLEALPQTSADAFDTLNPTLPPPPKVEKNPSEGLLPAGPLKDTPPQEANAASVPEKLLEREVVASPFHASSGPQPGKKGLKEKEESTLVNAERISEGLEKNQQTLSTLAANQASTAAGKTEAGTLDPLINHSDAQLSEQQTATSPKVIVQSGDNLTEIALQHYPHKERSGIEAILKSNPHIENRDLIYPGQVLVLPEIEAKAAARQESGEKTENTFAVQICTLFNASSAFAEAYVTELKQKGYPAYSTETKTKNDKIIYKIFIGNYSTKEETETAAMNFQKNEGKPDIIIKPEIAQPLESKEEEK